ncbi:MAG: ASKHA domain-containing protein [Dehalococcoidia bacterium]|nr:ASKHA domain-containing protein [Dehalococcoidia bacterium]
MTGKDSRWQIVFQPSGRRGQVKAGTTVLEASRELGAEIETICGEKRVCGKCKVRVESGFFERYGIESSPAHASPFTQEETKHVSVREKAQGYRLGCVARIQGHLVVFVPEESRTGKQVIRKAATQRAIDLNPAVRLLYLELEEPTLFDPLGDLDRLRRRLSTEHGIGHLSIDYHTLLELPGALRQGGWKVTLTLWQDIEIVAVWPGRVDSCYGLAVDIGTTTVAAYLCRLGNGEVVAADSMMNPQMAMGEDVMSRITYAMSHPDGGLERMRRALVEGLNKLVRSITGSVKLTPRDILEVALVGNTAMHHILLGIDPQHLGVSPFIPAVHGPLDIKARDLGLHVHPAANAHILPIEAGFVGADNVGVLIAEEPYNQDEIVLVVDIGTNGELVLGNRHRLLATSCATGPALEGAHIKSGMRAAPGAIERVRIAPQTYEVDYRVIPREGKSQGRRAVKPRGLCGSGIIDGVAELYRAGVIERSGRFRKDLDCPRLVSVEGQPEFVIARAQESAIGRDITISQGDVRNVQLAKAALYAGARMLMDKLGVEKVDRVVLAGAFGSYIGTREALVLGLFPDCPLNRIHAVGNAAGDGARIALLNRHKRREAEDVARRVEYVELTLEPDFQKHFVEAMHIPHMKDSFPSLQDILSG